MHNGREISSQPDLPCSEASIRTGILNEAVNGGDTAHCTCTLLMIARSAEGCVGYCESGKVMSLRTFSGRITSLVWYAGCGYL
jgi:hypothetical protein